MEKGLGIKKQCAANAVKTCAKPLTLVDLGGRPDENNAFICRGATHAILLAGDPERFPEWRAFCARAGLEIVAEVRSDYHGEKDRVQQNADGLLKGSIHYLERGEPVADRPMIQALARRLVTLVNAPASK